MLNNRNNEQNIGTEVVDGSKRKIREFYIKFMDNIVDNVATKLVVSIFAAIAMFIPGFTIVGAVALTIILGYVVYKYVEAKSIDALNSDFDSFLVSEKYYSVDNIIRKLERLLNSSNCDLDKVSRLLNKIGEQSSEEALALGEKMAIIRAIVVSKQPILLPSYLSLNPVDFLSGNEAYEVNKHGNDQRELLYMMIIEMVLIRKQGNVIPEVYSKNLEFIYDGFTDEHKQYFQAEISKILERIESQEQIDEMLQSDTVVSKLTDDQERLLAEKSHLLLKQSESGLDSKDESRLEEINQNLSMVVSKEYKQAQNSSRAALHDRLPIVKLLHILQDNAVCQKIMGQNKDRISNATTSVIKIQIKEEQLESILEQRLSQYKVRNTDEIPLTRADVIKKFNSFREDKHSERGFLNKAMDTVILPFRVLGRRKLNKIQDELIQEGKVFIDYRALYKGVPSDSLQQNRPANSRQVGIEPTHDVPNSAPRNQNILHD